MVQFGVTKNAEVLVRNGWALADHSAMEPAGLIARENKRGRWRGKFIPPKRWRNGERLPGENALAGSDQPGQKP